MAVLIDEALLLTDESKEKFSYWKS